MNEIDFPCDRCGACCRNLWMFGKPYEWLLDSQNGMCRYFDTKSNLCLIYPIRPIICNIQIGYKILFNNISFEEFIYRNIKGCNFLKSINKG